MIYNTEGISVNINKDNNYVEAGIIENVELKNVRYAVSPNGSEFIEFSFEDENGNKLTQTEYKPSSDDNTKLLDKTVKQMKRIMQIVCGSDDKNPDTITFISPSEYKIAANDFKSYCEAVIRILGNRFVGKKVRIKAVYSDKGYVTLPKYSTYVFIEPMSLPKEKSKIRILGIDQIVRPELSRPTFSNSSPFETIAAATKPEPTSDIPF